MSLDLDKFSKESSSEYPTNKKVKDKIKATRPKNLDAKFHQAHEQVFEKLDCLDCANCCKTTSPILIHTDIDRLSKVFRMRSSEFIDSYLFRDEEGDYVFKGAPCPFLGADNGCLVYEDRPSLQRIPTYKSKEYAWYFGLNLKKYAGLPGCSQNFFRDRQRL